MTDYQKLEAIYNEIDTLIAKRVMAESPEFESWHSRAERFLVNHFGRDNYEVTDFSNTLFMPMVYAPGADDIRIKACCDGLKKTKDIFKDYLTEIKEEMLEKDEESEKTAHTKLSHQNNKVFVVHGHDEALKEKVARLLEKQGLEAIILSEQANKGKTIIEKFEENSDVGAAICLFTGDDIGKEKSEAVEKQRARQNVVYEAGYFMGKLGRERVIMLVDNGIELPSDLQGVVYTDSESWKTEVLQELQSIGYGIDFNKLFKR
jgi:predicted nucleotide-binding protein